MIVREAVGVRTGNVRSRKRKRAALIVKKSAKKACYQKSNRGHNGGVLYDYQKDRRKRSGFRRKLQAA